MRQIGGENEDPLKRIQQEINEVKQRELELRNQLRYDKQQLSPASSGDQKSQAQQNSDDSGISTTSSSPINGTSANRSIDLDSSPTSHSHRFVDHNPEPAKQATPKKKLPTSNPTYVRSTSAAAFVFAPRNPKPALPVEYYVKPQPVKATAARAAAQKNSQHNMLTRTVSTPQLFHSVQHKVPARGFMQRFIETRGKMGSAGAAKPSADNGPVLNTSNNPLLISPTAQTVLPVRDSDGKPLRKGFVPVEEKIQKELREMRHREVELKIQRLKSVQYDSNNNLETRDDDSEPYKSLEYDEPSFQRGAKSIEGLDYSPRNSPSPRLEQQQRFKAHYHQNGGYPEKQRLRPAMSLAQLCDLDSAEELVSPNRLIAQFECMIQKNTSAVV